MRFLRPMGTRAPNAEPLLQIDHRSEREDRATEKRPFDGENDTTNGFDEQPYPARPVDDGLRSPLGARGAPEERDEDLVPVERVHRDEREDRNCGVEERKTKEAVLRGTGNRHQRSD